MPLGGLFGFSWLFLLCSFLACLFARALCFGEFVPVVLMFDGSFVVSRRALFSFIGSLLLFVGLGWLFVRWSSWSAFGAAWGCFFVCIHSSFVVQPVSVCFVLFGLYLFSVVFVLGAFHLFFECIPDLTCSLLLSY